MFDFNRTDTKIWQSLTCLCRGMERLKIGEISNSSKQTKNNAQNLPLGPEKQDNHFVDASRNQRPPLSAEHVHYIEHRAGNSMTQDSSGYKHSTGSLHSMFKLIRMRIPPAATS